MSILNDLLGRNRRQDGNNQSTHRETQRNNSEPTQQRGGAAAQNQGSATGTATSNITGGATRDPQRHTGAASAAAHGTTSAQPAPQGGNTTQGGATNPAPVQGAQAPAQGAQAPAQGARQGLAPVASPAAGQLAPFGGTDLAQRMATQALQGNAVYFGVLPDGSGGYSYQGFSSQLEMQAAVQGFSGQLRTQQAQGFSTGSFSEEAVLHAEFVILMDQLGRGVPTPETEHLKVQRLWEDTITGTLYADSRRIPATARSVYGRTAVVERANGRVIGYL